jgi:FAD/FMN-containing dehydrogenase
VSAEGAPRRLKRRRLALGLSVAALALAGFGRPVAHVGSAWLLDRDAVEPLGPREVDDASRMNRTTVADVVAISSDVERQVVLQVQRARREGLGLAVAGARHSQGGQTIPRGGIVLDLGGARAMELDPQRDVLRVQAGARWRDVIPFLNERGRAVAVMQSDADFSVGGSLSVDCHGWTPDAPPIASTVVALRVVTADGAVVRCSRTEEPDLFRHVLGGYGLFGVILEAELRVVPNERYSLERVVLPTSEWRAAYEARVRGAADVGLAYSRLCVAPDRFLQDMILSVFHRVPGTSGQLLPLPEPYAGGVRRALFRGSAGSDYGKGLRWTAEERLEERVGPAAPTRNELMFQTASLYLDRSAETTDILHEYFVPFARFEAFVERLRRLIPGRADLLNVTVRTVAKDEDAALRYADGDLVALVLFFSQRRTVEADAAMATLTRELIDAALAEGGRYYLPYRLHATPEQLRAAYPGAAEFFAEKRRRDPAEVFRNAFYDAYGR